MKKWLVDTVFYGKYKRIPVLVVFDLLCCAGVSAFYFLISRRADHSIPVSGEDLKCFFINTLVQLVLIFVFRFALKIYVNVWRYSSTKAYFTVVASDAAAGLCTLLCVRFLLNKYYYGIWEAVTVGSMTALIFLVSRFGYALLYKHVSKDTGDKRELIPTAIVGAGRLGVYLAGDLENNKNSKLLPVFFIDNDAAKVGQKVHGLKVYKPEEAGAAIQKEGVREVIIAITGKNGELLSELYSHYSALGCNVRIFESLVDGAQAKLREFTVEDLLFREPLHLMHGETADYYRGKTVLVTGGGGSIGSEICRQIAKCDPARLVIFDIYENNAYEIQQELVRKYGLSLNLTVEIGSVRDPEKLDEIFAAYRPNVVFHAAAHKHVPLMEHSASEAIKNNVLGTYNTANAAEKYGVEKFILISTDKAVNPTNIMGASKRVCEMIVQCRTDSRTTFAAVRFGNVLGSNGSVIPLFKKQIAEGGPVTITDKRIIRYFMTIPEASQLVIQAGAMAKSGELFVLDMGNPVKIYDLAENMIRLSGFVPGRDIRIEEIGLRPGEKLYEELLMKSETLTKTANNLIFIERDTPYSRAEVDAKIGVLTDAVKKHTSIKEAIASVVPTYHDPAEVNRRAEQSEEMKLTYAQEAQTAARSAESCEVNV